MLDRVGNAWLKDASRPSILPDPAYLGRLLVPRNSARFAMLNSRWQPLCVKYRPTRQVEHNCDTEGKTMTTLEATKSKASSGVTRSGRLFVLELSGDRIHSMNPDGSDRKTIVTNCRWCDGIVVDTQAGHIYWTNMGVPNLNDGSIERADLDGGNRRVIIAEGVTHTPKQLHLDKENSKLYWCDREGMRVMRANLDGSRVETLVETGRGDKEA